MMLVRTVTIAVLCGAAIAAEGEDGGDWSFRCQASVTVANADNPGGDTSEFMEGAPILFKVLLGLPEIPDDSPRGPSDIYYFGAGCPFIVVVRAAQEGAGGALKPELSLLTPFTALPAPSPGGRVWFSATWGFLDERLGSGSHVLKFRPTAGLLMIGGFEPAEISVHVRKPESRGDYYALARQKSRFYMCTGRLHQSESILLEALQDFPDYAQTAEALSYCYDALGDTTRSFAYCQEHVRRVAAGRPRNPEHAAFLGGRNAWDVPIARDRPALSDGQERHFIAAARKAGLASSSTEGRALLEKLFEDAKAGRDTGRLPAEFLTPILSSRASADGKALRALDVFLAAAVAVLGVMCVFLFFKLHGLSGRRPPSTPPP
ncbi:MAG: tetratricopeptide repeat protein [Planctomycetota bacterium]|jgi:hypothetical protein